MALPRPLIPSGQTSLRRFLHPSRKTRPDGSGATDRQPRYHSRYVPLGSRAGECVNAWSSARQAEGRPSSESSDEGRDVSGFIGVADDGRVGHVYSFG